MARILITGARAPVALDLVRQLARRGHTIWLADSMHFPAAAFSRFVERYVRTPAPRHDPKSYISVLAEIMNRHQIDLLIPTCEEIFYIARYLPDHIPKDRIFCAPFALLEKLHNKFWFAKNVRHVDVAAPETSLITQSSELHLFGSRSRELVFKPVFSRFASRTLIRPAVETLSAIVPSGADPWVAQRFIKGRELCSYSVARGGVLTAHACYDPLYRLGQSSSYYFKPESHPKIFRFVKDFVASHKFTGQISFDYILDEDGDYYVLECNPRAISGVHLFAKGAVLADAFLATCEGDWSNALTGPFMLAIAMAGPGLFSALKDRSLGTFVKNFRMARDVVLDTSDFKPFFAQFAMLAELTCRSVFRRQTFREASCDDIEWNGTPLA